MLTGTHDLHRDLHRDLHHAPRRLRRFPAFKPPAMLRAALAAAPLAVPTPGVTFIDRTAAPKRNEDTE